MEQYRVQRRLLNMEIIGVLAVCLLAFLFNSAYALSGNLTFVGIFTPVNASIWEHTKAIYFPMLFFAVAEYIVIRPELPRFLIAKSISLALVPLITICYYCTALYAFGITDGTVNTVFFCILVVVLFIVSYRIYCSKKINDSALLLFLILFFAVLAMEVLFTFFPPPLPMFTDPVTGLAGI